MYIGLSWNALVTLKSVVQSWLQYQQPWIEWSVYDFHTGHHIFGPTLPSSDMKNYEEYTKLGEQDVQISIPLSVML